MSDANDALLQQVLKEMAELRALIKESQKPEIPTGLALGAETLTASTVNDATLANHTHAITAIADTYGAGANLLKSDANGGLRLDRLSVGSPAGSPGQGEVIHNGYKLAGPYEFFDQELTSGSQANFDIQNIPAGFWKLVVELYGRGDTAAAYVALLTKLNNNATGANYYSQATGIAGTTLYGTQVLGTGVMQLSTIVASTGPANHFDTVLLEFPNYANTNGHKPVSAHGTLYTGTGATQAQIALGSGRYLSASAISRVTIYPAAGNFAQFCRCKAYLYK